MSAIRRGPASQTRLPSGRSWPQSAHRRRGPPLLETEGRSADPERSPALARRASAVVRSADAGIRFLSPYGQKESLDPDNPSPTSGRRPCWNTRRSTPYPTRTPWPNRNPTTSSTSRCSSSPPPRPSSPPGPGKPSTAPARPPPRQRPHPRPSPSARTRRLPRAFRQCYFPPVTPSMRSNLLSLNDAFHRVLNLQAACDRQHVANGGAARPPGHHPQGGIGQGLHPFGAHGGSNTSSTKPCIQTYSNPSRTFAYNQTIACPPPMTWRTTLISYGAITQVFGENRLFCGR